jgi:hypothetical protein
MTIEAYAETIRGIVGIAIRRSADNSNIMLPAPTAFSIAPNAEEAEISAMNPLGQQVTIGSIVRAVKPRLSLTFNVHQPEVYEFILGRRFTQQSRPGIAMREVTVPTSLEVAGYGPGSMGNGVAADQTTPEECSVVVKNQFGASVPLTRVPWASTPGPGEFAQGPDFALKFGPDLVNQVVKATMITADRSVLAPSAQSIGFLQMRAMFALTTNRIVIINANSVTPVVGSNVEPMGEDLSIEFYMHSRPGDCQSINMEFTDEYVDC